MAEGVVLGEGAANMKIVKRLEYTLDLVVIDPLPKKNAVEIDAYTTAFVAVYIFSALLFILTTDCRCGVSFRDKWFSKSGNFVRANLKKAAFYNILFNTAVFSLYVVLPSFEFDPIDGDLTDCVYPLMHTWTLCILVILAIGSACLRYMSHLLRHERDVCGYAVYSPPPLDQLGNIFTSKYSSVIALSSVLAILPMTIIGFRLHAVSSELSVAKHFVLCTPEMEEDEEWKVTAKTAGITTLIAFLPLLVALVMEHIVYCGHTRMKTKIPGFYLVVSSPFVTSQMVTSWSSWLLAMALTCYVQGNVFRLHCASWAVIGTADSLTMLLTFASASCIVKHK